MKLYHKSIIKHVVIPEFLSIIKKWGFIILLFFIVFSSLFIIGFNNGCQKYFNRQMNNPFVRFVPVNRLNSFQSNDFNSSLLNDSVLASRFNYKIPVEEVYTWNIHCLGLDKADHNCYIRMLNGNNEFFDFLTLNSGVIKTGNRKSTQKENYNWGCIISGEFLKDLKYLTDTPSFITIQIKGNPTISIPIAVAAVATDLPDKHDMLVSDELYTLLRSDFLGEKSMAEIAISDSSRSDYFIQTTDNIGILESNLTQFGIHDFSLEESKNTFHPGFIVHINESPNSAKEPLDKFCKLWKYHPPMNSINYSNYLQKEKLENKNPGEIKFLNVYFNDLSKVEAFNKYAEDSLTCYCDMTTIQTKDLFSVLSKILNTANLSAIVFSLFTICYIFSSIFYFHIESNRKNLGTLKAFGLQTNRIILLFNLINLTLLLPIFAFSYLLTELFGNSLADYIIQLTDLNLKSEARYYSQFEWPWLIFLFLVIPLILNIIINWIILRNQTPGKLIYNN